MEVSMDGVEYAIAFLVISGALIGITVIVCGIICIIDEVHKHYKRKKYRKLRKEQEEQNEI
jgi:hypothetical protein